MPITDSSKKGVFSAFFRDEGAVQSVPGTSFRICELHRKNLTHKNAFQ